MDPMLEKIPEYPGSSIAVKREVTPYMDYPWHYHPEYELIYVEKSYGIRLMGDHIGHFNDGDLVFISAHLPHVWRNDQAFYQNNEDLFVDVYVIHFLEQHFGDLFSLVESALIRDLFRKGQRGLRIFGKTHELVSSQIKAIYRSSGFKRLTLLLEILDLLSKSDEYEPLSSPGFNNGNNIVDSERISVVYEYVIQNFDKPISLAEVAAKLHLNKTSFCRYFKSRTTKTFSHFVNEVRIGKACKMLINSNLTICQVSHNVGYNNISHFNRQFKLFTGATATEYRRKHWQHAASL